MQIDQRYSAVHNQAYRIWRPLQVVVFLLLIGVGVMFVRWLRQAPASVEHPTAPQRRLGHGRRAEDQDVRDVLARADRAERTARETKERLRELEAAVAAAPSTATATAALEELDLKLRASEAEREELAATVLRLQGSLSERDADVALARDGSGSRADTKRINKLIADAESKVVAAERKAAAADKKTQEAAKRARVTAERMLEMEAQLKEAERKAADAQKLTATVDKRGSSAEKKVADAEQRTPAGRADYVTASDEGRPPSQDVGDVEDGYPSLEAFGDGGAPHTWETTGPPPEREPTVEPEEGGLSLRERLARAAAGRKRLS